MKKGKHIIAKSEQKIMWKKIGVALMIKFIRVGKIIFYAFGLLVILLVAAVIFWPRPDARSVLEENLVNYEHFFGDREIVEYEYDRGFQYSMFRIKTSVSLDRVLELFNTQILADCGKEDFECADPPLSDSVEAHPGEYCMSAKDPSNIARVTRICIDTRTGDVDFYRQRG